MSALAKVRADLRKQFDQKKADEEHEMERRVDLIKQIRALDKMKNVVKVDTFDPCEPPRHGMMEEMSLAELRERLQMMNEAHNRMLEKLHDGILSKKDEKKGEIEAKHENIKKIRNIAAVEAAQRRDKLRNKKEDEERQKEELRRQRFDEVTAKLDAKQKAREAEEKRLKKELKLMSLKRLFDDLKTGKDSTTRRLEDVVENQERYNNRMDARDEAVALGARISRARDAKIVADNSRQVLKEFQTMQSEVEGRLEASRKEYALRKEEVRNTKQTAFNKQVDYERMLRKKRIKEFPADAEMKKLTITQAMRDREREIWFVLYYGTRYYVNVVFRVM